jgi:hypothetical protein
LRREAQQAGGVQHRACHGLIYKVLMSVAMLFVG